MDFRLSFDLTDTWVSFCAYSAHRGTTICIRVGICPTHSTYRASERPQEVLTAIRKTGVVYRIVVAANWLYLQLAACNLLDRIQCILMQDRLQSGIVFDEIFCHIPIFLFM